MLRSTAWITKVLKYPGIQDLHPRAPSFQQNGADSSLGCSMCILGTWLCSSSTHSSHCVGVPALCSTLETGEKTRVASTGVQSYVSQKGGNVQRKLHLSTVYRPFILTLPIAQDS